MLRESGEKGRKVGGRVVVSLSGSFETTDKPLSCLGTNTNFTVRIPSMENVFEPS